MCTSVHVLASPVSDLFWAKKSTYGKRNDVAMVMFYTSGNVHSAMGNLKQLMHTRDKGAFSNPYWIINFFAEAVDPKTGCGVVFGEWYTNNFSYRGTWEKIMDKNMGNYADTVAYFYSHNDGFVPTTDHQSHSNALEKICIKPKKK